MHFWPLTINSYSVRSLARASALLCHRMFAGLLAPPCFSARRWARMLALECSPRRGSAPGPYSPLFPLPCAASTLNLTHCPNGWRYTSERGQGTTIMDALAEKLDARLRKWKPETAAEARERIAEVIELADHGVLDVARSRAAEQEVLNLLDEPPAR